MPTKTNSTRRRERGSGSIELRGADSYRLILTFPDGVQRRPFRGTREEAEQALRDWRYQREHGVAIAVEKISLGEFLEQWLQDYATNRVAPSTLRRYGELAGRIAEEIGSIRLQSLRWEEIQAVYRRLESGTSKHKPLSKRTVLHHHRVLREALQHAVKWRYLPANPADAASPPRPARTEIQALTAREVSTLLSGLQGQDRTLAYVAVQTGARLGELLALRWADVDLEAGTASIRRSLDSVGPNGPLFREPKTKQANRSIALSADTIRVLRHHRAAQAEQRLSVGPIWQDLDLVFPNDLGGAAGKTHVSQRIIRVGRSLDLSGFRFHDLRHSAATLMLQAGIHPKIVSERLGHSTIAITLDIYSHVTPTMQRQAAAALDGVLEGVLKGSYFPR